MGFEIIGFIISLALLALFSFLETAITAMRYFKLKELAHGAPRHKYILNTLLNNPHRILITILIASSLANTLSATLCTRVFQNFFAHMHFNEGFAFSIGIAIASAALLIFGEIIPKNFAKMHGERMFISTLWLINMVYWLFYPFVKILTVVSDFFISLFTRQSNMHGEQALTSEKEIKFMIDYIGEKKLMDREKAQMLQNVMEIGDTPIREIMIPENDIISISAKLKVSEALQTIAKYQFTRIPVYDKKRDNIIGMIYQKDIFLLLSKNESDKLIKDILRPITFVPETTKSSQLLQDFRKRHAHIAMVLNEFGGIAGLVTLEDILEEIVGEISDEHEPIEKKAIELENGNWLVDASMNLSDVSKLIGIDFLNTDAITLAGFLTEKLQHMPSTGEQVHYKSYCFQIHQASHKRILQVLIFKDAKKK